MKNKTKKHDWANPSMIALAFNQRNIRWEFFKKEARKKGIVIREIIPIDIQIPVDEKYNEAVNFLKENISPILKNYAFNFPFRDLIFKQLRKKTKLVPFDYENFEKDFVKSNKYPFGYLGLTPLFIDGKYIDADAFNNELEEANYNKLFSLESKEYKPLKTPTAKEEYFKDVKEN